MKTTNLNDIEHILDELNEMAKVFTTCNKTYVGACLGYTANGNFYPRYYGFNSNQEYNCKEKGCYRKLLFNNDSKEFRPWCKAIHAEENAVASALRDGVKDCDTIIVTRYPCEKCARLLIHYGIKRVIYGRPFKIESEVAKMFEDAGIIVEHKENWNGDVNDDNR